MPGRIAPLLCLLALPLSAATSDLAIEISTPSRVAAQGEPIAYEIVATNNGPNDAAGVTMKVVLPPQLLFQELRATSGWACMLPAVGANGTITCTREVLPAANGTPASFLLGTIVDFAATGSIVNSASVSHSGTDPNPGNSSASSEATAVQPTVADLSVTKTTGAAWVPAGGALTYAITVTNSGPGTASRVTLTDELPVQLWFASRVITATAGTDFSCTTPQEYRNGTITCSAARMAPGATATLMLEVVAVPHAARGTVTTNTATVTSPTADPDSGDRSATAPGVEIVPGADLSITNETWTTRARPNAVFDYWITILNIGPDPATNVVMTDVLPPDLLFEYIGGAPGTCTTPAVGTNGTVTCTVPTIPVSMNETFLLRVRVAPGASPGVVTNTASFTSATLDPRHGSPSAVAEPVTIVAPAGAERRLDADSAAPQMPQLTPQVATTRQNALAVWGEGWVSYVPQGSAASIRGALFRPDAEGETILTFAAPVWGTHFAYPVVAAAADRYLVVWREIRSSQGRILARRLRVDGSFIDAEPLVLQTGTAVECCTDVGDPRPSVASNGQDFYVTWVSKDRHVWGIVVPGEGAVTAEPLILSRETEVRLRGRYDLEVVWTSMRYVVVWLDRVFQLDPPMEQPFVLRSMRVTATGFRLDHPTSSIAGPAFRSIAATPSPEGAVVTVDYLDPTSYPASGWPIWCVGVLPLTASGEPGALRPLHCDGDAASGNEVAVHSAVVPVARGFLLLQPGRRYPMPFGDFRIRTSIVDAALTRLSEPTWLGAVGHEVSAASWHGAALLVYNRTVPDPDPAMGGGGPPRVFSFLIPSHSRARAVRR